MAERDHMLADKIFLVRTISCTHVICGFTVHPSDLVLLPLPSPDSHALEHTDRPDRPLVLALGTSTRSSKGHVSVQI